MFKTILVVVALAYACLCTSAMAQSQAQAREAQFTQARIVPFASPTGTTIDCDFNKFPSVQSSQCVDPPVPVKMWAAGKYGDGTYKMCVAEILATDIAVPSGKLPGLSPHLISWKLTKADPQDGDYSFQKNGIEMGQSGDKSPIKPRHRVTSDDLKDPTASGDKQTFTWTVVNSHKRGHDPSGGGFCYFGANAFCDIAYVATVVDSKGVTCESVDPTVINGGN